MIVLPQTPAAARERVASGCLLVNSILAHDISPRHSRSRMEIVASGVISRENEKEKVVSTQLTS